MSIRFSCCLLVLIALVPGAFAVWTQPAQIIA